MKINMRLGLFIYIMSITSCMPTNAFGSHISKDYDQENVNLFGQEKNLRQKDYLREKIVEQKKRVRTHQRENSKGSKTSAHQKRTLAKKTTH